MIDYVSSNQMCPVALYQQKGEIFKRSYDRNTAGAKCRNELSSSFRDNCSNITRRITPLSIKVCLKCIKYASGTLAPPAVFDNLPLYPILPRNVKSYFCDVHVLCGTLHSEYKVIGLFLLNQLSKWDPLVILIEAKELSKMSNHPRSMSNHRFLFVRLYFTDANPASKHSSRPHLVRFSMFLLIMQTHEFPVDLLSFKKIIERKFWQLFILQAGLLLFLDAFLLSTL